MHDTATSPTASESPVPTEPAAPTGARRFASDRSKLIVGVVLALAVAAVAVWRANDGGSWRLPFFFDEMWRVDFIRSSHPIDRMLVHDTPIPLGWVELMHLVTAPLPYRPVVFRVIVVGWFLVGLGVLTVLFARIAQRAPRPSSRATNAPAWMRAPIPWLAAPIGVGLICFVPPVSKYIQWFNNYTFEVLYVALMVLAAEELDRWPSPARAKGRRPKENPAFWALCALLGLSPLFVLGGLFVVPALLVGAAWWAWRDDPHRRRPRLTALASSGAVLGAIGAVEWVTIYKPVSAKPSISTYWIDSNASLGGPQTLTDLVGHTFQQVSSGLIGDRLYFDGGAIRALAYALLAVAVVVGAVAVGRRWPWLLATIASAWLLSIVASALVHWPMTMERVNLCWQILFFAMAGFGAARAVLWFTPKHPALSLPVFALLFAGLWFEPYDPGVDAFARNLTYDLQSIPGRAAPRNIVFQYHELAHFNADNELVNTAHPGQQYDIVAQLPDTPTPFEPIDARVRERRAEAGDMVWCIIPYELGASSAQACRVSDPSSLELVVDERGKGARVIGYRVR